MSATVLDMSMSLDGFIAGSNETRENGLGDGGLRLHEWVFAGADAPGHKTASPGGVNGQVFAELMSTGAVVAGRGTVEPAGYWSGDHHDGVPIFILSRDDPPEEARQWPLITFVDDVATAMAGRGRPPETGTSSSTAPAPRSSRSPPASLTSSSSTSSPSSSARAGGCSRVSRPSRSSSSRPAFLRATAASLTCTTASCGEHRYANSGCARLGTRRRGGCVAPRRPPSGATIMRSRPAPPRRRPPSGCPFRSRSTLAAWIDRASTGQSTDARSAAQSSCGTPRCRHAAGSCAPTRTSPRFTRRSRKPPSVGAAPGGAPRSLQGRGAASDSRADTVSPPLAGARSSRGCREGRPRERIRAAFSTPLPAEAGRASPPL